MPLLGKPQLNKLESQHLYQTEFAKRVLSTRGNGSYAKRGNGSYAKRILSTKGEGQ